jgi:long-chain acyl-CoA synthetase
VIDRLAARMRLAAGRDVTLASLTDHIERIHGARVLVREGQRARTAADLAGDVDRWARVISTKVAKGDRVVVAVPNGADLVLVALATSRAGAVPVPVNDQLRDNEVAAIARSATASLVVRDVRELAGSGGEIDTGATASDVAALFATSGTTGRPKLAELTHRGLLGSSGTAAISPIALRRDEAVIALPLAHIMGFAALLGCLSAGVVANVLPRFRPTDVFDLIERRRASVFIGVPTMYRMMEEAGAATRRLSSVRAWVSGADVMPSDLARRFQRYGATLHLPLVGDVGEAVFVEGYGMVELAGAAAAKVALPFAGSIGGLGGALGFALPGWRMRVIGPDGRQVRPGEVGELQVRGPGSLVGYFGDDTSTESVRVRDDDGWVRTGDLARRGLAGAVSFAGRDKDVVKHGGYSVYALDVQMVLEAHPAIAEAAVTGREDPIKGEVPVAAVRLHPGMAVAADDVIAFAAERLAPYQVPDRIVVVDDFPRTATGKVQRGALRVMLATPATSPD